MTDRLSTMLVTIDNANDFNRQFVTLFGPLDSGVSTVTITAQGPLCRGRIEVHAVRPGMRLFVMDMDVSQDMELPIEPVHPGVLISLVMEGRSGYRMPRGLGRDEVWEFLPSRNVVGCFQPEKSLWSVAAGAAHRLVELYISPGRASQLLSEYREASPGRLHSLLAHRDGLPKSIHAALSPELRAAANQVLTCRIEGAARRLYMESKALEILALQLDALASPDVRESLVRGRDERDRLEEARRILDSEFADPPSLVTLARRVGLNDFKLKRGFRDIYQTTVFGYLRMIRMERARAMLESGDLNVTEAASATGYSCFGHFAGAFRKRFGIAPSDLKRARRT